MGHHAYLGSSPFPELPATEEELRVITEHPGRAFTADGFVPIFWLAMFGTDDVGEDPAPHLVRSKKDALATLERRRTGIELLVGPRFSQLLAQFVDLVEAEMGPYILVRLGDLAARSESPDDFAAELRAALMAIGVLTMAREKATPAVQKVLASFCALEKGWAKKDNATTRVSGEAPGWPETPEESTWRRALLGHPPEDFKAFGVNVALVPGDLVKHEKFGNGIVTSMRGPEKAEILFRAGPKTLACTAGSQEIVERLAPRTQSHHRT